MPTGIAEMTDVSLDPALSLQLTEATHASYRAALALESVQAATGAAPGVRRPFLAEDRVVEPGEGPGSTLSDPAAVDDPLGRVASGGNVLDQFEIPGVGRAGESASVGLGVGTLDPDAVSGHGTRSRELLQSLADDLNAVVVHSIFEGGHALHGALQRTTDPRAPEQIEGATAIFDEAISTVRSIVCKSGQV